VIDVWHIQLVALIWVALTAFTCVERALLGCELGAAPRRHTDVSLRLRPGHDNIFKYITQKWFHAFIYYRAHLQPAQPNT
jgi:hypothetical protein